MVVFEKEGINESFTIKVEYGGREEYLSIIKSMLFYLSHCNNDGDNRDETYFMCKMIESMLPNEEQIVNIEDVELLNELKTKKK